MDGENKKYSQEMRGGGGGPIAKRNGVPCLQKTKEEEDAFMVAK